MRIVNVPLVWLKRLNSNSWYLAMEDLVAYTPEEDFFYWFSDSEIMQAIRKRMEKRWLEWKVSYVEQEVFKFDFYNYVFNFDFKEFASYFNQMFWLYPIDCVFVHSPEIVYSMKRWIVDLRSQYQDIPIFILEQKVWEEREEKINPVWYILYNFWYILGYPIFLWEHEKMAALRQLTKYFRWSVLDEFLKKAKVLPLWVDTEYIDKIKVWLEGKRQVKTLYYWGRINDWKKTDIIFNEYFYIKAGWYDVDVWITTWWAIWNQKSVSESLKRLDFAKIFENQWREDYLKKATKCHVWLVASKTEGFPVWYMEMLYAWVILVFPDYDRVRSWIPKEYPFIYKNIDEARAMLRWIIENYEEAREKTEFMRKYIKDEYDVKVVAMKYRNYFQEVVEKENDATKLWRWNIQLVKDAFKVLRKEKQIERAKLIATMKKISKTFELASRLKSQSLSQFQLYKAAKCIWAKDIWKNPLPIFENPYYWKTLKEIRDMRKVCLWNSTKEKLERKELDINDI